MRSQTATERAVPFGDLVSMTPLNSVITIEPSKGWVPLGLKELWQHRELLYFLSWRDRRS